MLVMVDYWWKFSCLNFVIFFRVRVNGFIIIYEDCKRWLFLEILSYN